MSFKQLCSRVAAITGPWNCVVYRDIRLLKAHSCRVASPAIAWAMQLLVGVVLYVIYTDSDIMALCLKWLCVDYTVAIIMKQTTKAYTRLPSTSS